MIIQAEIDIQAPPGVVWQVFASLEEWGRWNTACHECRLMADPYREERLAVGQALRDRSAG